MHATDKNAFLFLLRSVFNITKNISSFQHTCSYFTLCITTVFRNVFTMICQKCNKILGGKGPSLWSIYWITKATLKEKNSLLTCSERLLLLSYWLNKDGLPTAAQITVLFSRTFPNGICGLDPLSLADVLQCCSGHGTPVSSSVWSEMDQLQTAIVICAC